MKTFYLQDDIYYQPLLIVLGCSLEELKKHLKRKFSAASIELPGISERSAGAAFYLEFPEKERQYVIWFDSQRKDTNGITCIAHEVFHAAFEIMGDRGVEYSDDSEEAFAYYFSYLFGQVLNKLYSRKKKK